MSRKNVSKQFAHALITAADEADEWMSADIHHIAEAYHVRGEMIVRLHTTKSAETFQRTPRFDGMVAQFTLTYTRRDGKHRVSFYYDPLREQYLDEDAFEELLDCANNRVLLAMPGKDEGMKPRLVLRPSRPLQYIPKLADVCSAPSGVVHFASLFLKRLF